MLYTILNFSFHICSKDLNNFMIFFQIDIFPLPGFVTCLLKIGLLISVSPVFSLYIKEHDRSSLHMVPLCTKQLCIMIATCTKIPLNNSYKNYIVTWEEKVKTKQNQQKPRCQKRLEQQEKHGILFSIYTFLPNIFFFVLLSYQDI